jgi:hypothetical protein
LRDLNAVYKRDAIYLMQYIGGVLIFRFSKAFSTIGILGHNCVADVPQSGHVVLGTDDVILHNGTSAETLMNRRMRRDLFGRIDSTYYARSFVVLHHAAREVWVCIPEIGATAPSLAYIWSWVDNTWGVRELNAPAFAVMGAVNTGESLTWNSDSAVWNSDGSRWDIRAFNPTVSVLLGAHNSSTQIRRYDSGGTFNGAEYTSFIERTGLGVPINQRDATPDISSVKFLRGLWPRIEGANQGTVNVSVGGQWLSEGSVEWQPAVPFTIGQTNKIDCRVSGRMLAVRFEAVGGTDWRLHGFDLDIVPGGNF